MAKTTPTDSPAPEDPEVIPAELPDAPSANADEPNHEKNFHDAGAPIDGPNSLTGFPSSRV